MSIDDILESKDLTEFDQYYLNIDKFLNKINIKGTKFNETFYSNHFKISNIDITFGNFSVLKMSITIELCFNYEKINNIKLNFKNNQHNDQLNLWNQNCYHTPKRLIIPLRFLFNVLLDQNLDLSNQNIKGFFDLIRDMHYNLLTKIKLFNGSYYDNCYTTYLIELYRNNSASNNLYQRNNLYNYGLSNINNNFKLNYNNNNNQPFYEKEWHRQYEKNLDNFVINSKIMNVQDNIFFNTKYNDKFKFVIFNDLGVDINKIINFQ